LNCHVDPRGIGILLLLHECLVQAEQGPCVARVAHEILAEYAFGIRLSGPLSAAPAPSDSRIG
jgi:hypothetical protein